MHETQELIFLDIGFFEVVADQKKPQLRDHQFYFELLFLYADALQMPELAKYCLEVLKVEVILLADVLL